MARYRSRKAAGRNTLVGSSPTLSAFTLRSGELRRTKSAGANREGEIRQKIYVVCLTS